MRKSLLLGGLVVSLPLSCVCGWLLGGHLGEAKERHLRFDKERELVTPLFTNNPAFEQLQLMEETGPGGGIILFGSVKTPDDLKRLRAELVRLLGEPRAEELLRMGLVQCRLDASRAKPN